MSVLNAKIAELTDQHDFDATMIESLNAQIAVLTDQCAVAEVDSEIVALD
jgi:hypothetical protein